MTDVEILKDCIARKGKILICGNGGSAAQAQHLAAELMVRFEKERAPIAAIALTADSAVITAIANDYGYEYVFSRQIQALGRPGDVLIALSTSFKSANVLEAIEAAENIGMAVIQSPNDAHDVAGRQEDHLQWLHTLCRELGL